MTPNKVKFIEWETKHNDNNEGLIYGICDLNDFPDYIEWFGSKKERQQYAIKNKFKVVGK